MMYSATKLQLFTREELLNLLSTCAYHLNIAYQEIQAPELWRASNEASIACEFLRFEIASLNKTHPIH